MQPKVGQIHVFRLVATVQNGEDVFYFLYVIGLYTLRFTLHKQPLQPFVLEPLNQHFMMS